MPVITILNNSFESQVLNDGRYVYGVDDWILSGGDYGGVYNPKSSYVSGVTGQNVTYLYTDGESISQEVNGYTYSSNEEIIFSVDIGDPSYDGAQDYRVEIVVGGTVVGSTDGNTGDTDSMSTVTVFSTVSDPSLNGQSVTFKIIKVGSNSDELFIDNAQASYFSLANGVVEGTNYADTIDIGYTDSDGDIVDGSDGANDSIHGWSGHDVINAGRGHDTIFGDSGRDTLFGDGGADKLDGGGGDDVIDGGVGADTIYASSGSDDIDGGSNSDTYSAVGAQTIALAKLTVNVDNSGDGTVLKSIGGTDKVASIDTFIADESQQTDSITLLDNTVDHIDYDPSGELYNISEIADISDDAEGIFTPYYNDTPIPFGPSADLDFSDILAMQTRGQIQITGGDETGQVGNISYQDFETINFGVLCFAKGTLIKCEYGETPIEELSVGDRIATIDDKYKPIKWIGSRHIDACYLQKNMNLRPIVIEKDALAFGFPAQNLTVSPQHRILIRSKIAQRIFGTDEVLVPANKLLDIDGIKKLSDLPNGITYYHILFDCHEIIFSNGAFSESLFTGPEALATLTKEAQDEIMSLFPEICNSDFKVSPARLIPQKGKDARKLAQRHKANKRPLYGIN
jgi:hypothetical protein